MTSEGVSEVMAILKLAYGIEKSDRTFEPPKTPSATAKEEDDAFDTRCEEVLLSDFADPAGENLV